MTCVMIKSKRAGSALGMSRNKEILETCLAVLTIDYGHALSILSDSGNRVYVNLPRCDTRSLTEGRLICL